MSQVYYQKVWVEAQRNLKQNLLLEAKMKKKSPFQDRNFAKWLIGHLFVNYVQVANELDRCYDQMVHPQKRELLKRLLDLSIGRLLELKAEIVKIEYDNYCFLDDVLIELKLTHDDMEIHVPRHYWRDREKIMAHRRILINQVFEEAEREKFRLNYLKNVPEEAREEVWEKYLAKEKQQKLEKEKLEEQQQKLLGGRARELTSLEKLLNEIMDQESGSKEDERRSLSESILLIQCHERARQGRWRATWAKKYKRMKEKGVLAVAVPEEVTRKAATTIQRYWRRYRLMCSRKKEDAKLKELLGMTIINTRNNLCEEERVKNIERLRRKIGEKNEKEFLEAFAPVENRIKALYAMYMEEDIVEEIRNWFEWFFYESNVLPDFPPPDLIVPTGEILGVPKALGPAFAAKAFPKENNKLEKNIPNTALGRALCGLSAIGGSALIVAGHWIGPKEFLICQKEMEKPAKGNELKEASKEKPEKKKKKESNSVFQLKESNFLEPLNKAERDYSTIWKDLDERLNYEQRFVYDMLQEEKCWELSMEIRRTVDDMMLLELDILKDALERDRNPGKKRKSKTSKPKKEKKSKQKKDPTGDRTLDDLFMELFRNGIIKDYDTVHINEYLGERSYCAFEFRRKNQEQPPSPGDVKELILQLCILPLASTRIHQLAPLIKSVCLMGPENSAKEFLARIVCTETAAVMFDLSSSNVFGKYPGKSGLKKLEHLVEKMSRALQPSVIFVDATEKTFYKKIPKEERHADPKRMAGVISKLAKNIKVTDQVMVLGVTSQPWLANRNKLLKTYQQIVYVYPMDYANHFKIWQSLLANRQCVSKDFDVSCLAKSSWGFSAKAIIDAIKNIFTIERISTSQYNLLKPKEFLEELIKQSQPSDENSGEKCFVFFNSTDLPKKRAKKMQQLKEELEKTKKK